MSSPSGSPALERRLDLLERFAAAVQDLETALIAGELERVEALLESLEGLRRQVDELPEAAPVSTPALAGRVASTLETLTVARSQYARIRQAMGGARAEIGSEIRTLSSRQPQIRSYLGGPSGGGPREGGLLDVRS